MADFTEINEEINAEINTNGANEITGAKLNQVLHDMITAVNDGKQDSLPLGNRFNVPVFNDNGQIVDSGIPIANIQKRFVVDDIEQVDGNLLTNALEVGDVLIVSTTMYQPKQAYVAVSQTIIGGKWVFASANENDITFVFYENNEYVNTVVVPIG